MMVAAMRQQLLDAAGGLRGQALEHVLQVGRWIVSVEPAHQRTNYLAQLQLTHKVEVKDGVLSTTDLSHGQRKRLALLTAYLEDREIYVFDEWAADQDPSFKRTFYDNFLPELKAKGKAEG